MEYLAGTADVAVIGAGHAGVEAAQLRSFVVTGQGGVNQRQDGIHRLSYLAYAGLDAAVVEFH